MAVDIVATEAAETILRNTLHGGEAPLYLHCDITQSASVQQMVATVVDRFGRIDVMFNNAAIQSPAPAIEISDEAWEYTANISLKGTFICSREVAGVMRSQGSGSIINMASIAGLIGIPRGVARLRNHKTLNGIGLANIRCQVNQEATKAVYLNLEANYMEHGYGKPRGCLMIEQRLIERAIKLMEAETRKLESGGALEPLTIDTLADFIRTYADRCHHGKEEYLLFDDLSHRPLSSAEKDLMNELIEEHELGRHLTRELVEAKNDVLAGQHYRLADVISTMKALTEFYPPHIEKEDAHFFPETERHYIDQDLETMIQSFYTFDMRMIHEKYASVLETMESPR